MKKLLFFAVSLFFPSLLFSQVTPEAFLANIPSLPNNVCNDDQDEKDAFIKKLYDLEAEIEAVINPKKQIVEDAYQNSKVDVEKNIAKEYNLSGADMQKLKQIQNIKDKKQKKEEQKKIADKILQDKTNISMEEIEKLKKMSKEGKKAWVEAYSTEQMATMEGKTDSINAFNQKNMDKYNLAQEQSKLMNQVDAVNKMFANKIKELNEEDSVATIAFLVERDTIMAHLGDYYAEEYERAIEKIRELEKQYCETMTPQYFDILNDQTNKIKTLLPTFYKLEKVNAELSQATLNVQNKDFYSEGLMGLETVKGHITLLTTAFKYAHYSFPKSMPE